MPRGYSEGGSTSPRRRRRFLTRGLDWTCDVDAAIANATDDGQLGDRGAVHNEPVSHYVANWAGVRRTLANSSYAYLLQDAERR